MYLMLMVGGLCSHQPDDVLSNLVKSQQAPGNGIPGNHMLPMDPMTYNNGYLQDFCLILQHLDLNL